MLVYFLYFWFYGDIRLIYIEVINYYMRKILIAFCLVAMVLCAPVAAANITNCDVVNVNLYGTSVTDISTEGTFDAQSTASGISHENTYLKYDSVTDTPDEASGTISYQVNNLQGSTAVISTDGVGAENSLLWTFSDGSTATGLAITQNFATNGVYTARLTMSNSLLTTPLTYVVTTDNTILESYGSMENSRAAFLMIILLPLALAGILIFGIITAKNGAMDIQTLSIGLVTIAAVIIAIILMVVITGTVESSLFHT